MSWPRPLTHGSKSFFRNFWAWPLKLLWWGHKHKFPVNSYYSRARWFRKMSSKTNIITQIVDGQWRHKITIYGYGLSVYIHISQIRDVTNRLLFMRGYLGRIIIINKTRPSFLMIYTHCRYLMPPSCGIRFRCWHTIDLLISDWIQSNLLTCQCRDHFFLLYFCPLLFVFMEHQVPPWSWS